MREILFRGKRVDNGEWFEGSLLINDSLVDPEKWTYDIIGKNERRATERYWVITETVGQYTGLNDKNGKKIFEGDILRTAYYPEDDKVIEWNDGRFCFRKANKPKEWGYESVCCVQAAVGCLKVIGNIHDNPELLKGGVDNG